jgi:hypothetical protein
MRTDAEILDWLEAHPDHVIHFSHGVWRKMFGPKDQTNRFKTLRDAVSAQIDAGEREFNEVSDRLMVSATKGPLRL